MTRAQFGILIASIVLVGAILATTLILIDVQRRHDECLQRYDYPQSEIMCD